MAGNHLETLVAEWYEFQGYFVRRNVQVGKRAKGGYERELDIVAFNPETSALVHLEPSLGTDSWAKRELRYAKKFEAGKRYIPTLFKGIPIPEHIDQVALFVYGGGNDRTHLGGGRLMFVKDFMSEIRVGIRHRKVNNAVIPEMFPQLRTVQFAAQYWASGQPAGEQVLAAVRANRLRPAAETQGASQTWRTRPRGLA